MSREIKLITPEFIDDYLTIYLNAYPAFKNIGDEGRAKYRKRYLNSMEHDKNIHFYGLFEDGKLIAQMKLIDFYMNAFGEIKPACGLMALAVHPMHKKKGAALDMVRFFEKYTKETGAIVAMLLPFRIDFYRNMGYGYGSKMDEYRIPTVNLPMCKSASNIEFLDSSDIEDILKCQASFVSKNHGMLLKFEDEIRDMKGDSESRKIGFVENGNLRGYAIYDFICESDVNYTLNRIEVKELVYDNPHILRSLLGFIRNQSDLAQTTVIRTGEEDFYHILTNAQDTSGNYIDFGFLQTNISAVGTMYKIVDLKHFVESTKYRKFLPYDLSVKFDYYDELTHTQNEFCIKFSVSSCGKTSTWSVCSMPQKDVTVTCNLSDLSALFMGSCKLSSLVRLGAAKLSDNSFEDVLDSLFYCKQKPWTNTDY